MLSRHLATLQTLLTEAEQETQEPRTQKIFSIYVEILKDGIKVLQSLIEWVERK